VRERIAKFSGLQTAARRHWELRAFLLRSVAQARRDLTCDRTVGPRVRVWLGGYLDSLSGEFLSSPDPLL